MTRSVSNPWLHRFAVLTAIATFALVGLGGLVTSHNVGMSVPDWPTTYGYNMFRFPMSQWVGGIMYEHTHRLMGTIVGVLVVILTRWLGGRPSCKPLVFVGALEIVAGCALLWLAPNLRGTGHFLWGVGVVVLLAGLVLIRNKPAPGSLVALGWIVFVLVQVQGLLGGLRVVLIKDAIGIFHALLAQFFFVLLCAIALFTSRWWQNLGEKVPQLTDRGGLRRLLIFGTLLIFAQLMLGATMRHQHAGLSIPDFPLAYHKLWPPTDPASVRSYNQHRLDVEETNPITAFQIILQMVHRIVALFIFCAVAVTAWKARRNLGSRHPLSKFSVLWLGLIFFQIILGAATIWSNKAADIATAHVMTGALSLVLGALLTIVAFRVLIPVRVAAIQRAETASSTVLAGKPVATSAK
ncbi:MAG TPA: COX15/CtaA family protein [Verrucomicrobiae bacterium]|nr:COX15/CtaA family protein [Verrucomicrobiae bacterium]